MNETAKEYLASGDPVMSIDAKKKELRGNFKKQRQREQTQRTKNTIETSISENNDKFAIRIRHALYITKRRGEASSIVYFDKEHQFDDAVPVQIIKQLEDPNETHRYR